MTREIKVTDTVAALAAQNHYLQTALCSAVAIQAHLSRLLLECEARAARAERRVEELLRGVLPPRSCNGEQAATSN